MESEENTHCSINHGLGNGIRAQIEVSQTVGIESMCPEVGQEWHVSAEHWTRNCTALQIVLLQKWALYGSGVEKGREWKQENHS